MTNRLLPAVMVAAAVSACSSGHVDMYDQVKDFRINWSDPQLGDLGFTLAICEASDTEREIAKHCRTRRAEARAIIDSVVTCQEAENATFPACQQVNEWRSSREIALAEFLRRTSPDGLPADLSSVWNLYKPSNAMLRAVWSDADRKLAFANGAWVHVLAILVTSIAMSAAIGVTIRNRRRMHASALTVPPPIAESEAELRPALCPPPPEPVAVAVAVKSVDQRDTSDTAAEAIAEEEERDRLEQEARRAAERAAERQRRAEEVARRRAADEQAKRDFDRLNDLS